MHIVTSQQPLLIRGAVLESMRGYYMNSTGVGSLLTNRELVPCPGSVARPIYRLVEVRPAEERKLSMDREYERIFLFRSGGFGDLIMLTSLVQVCKYLWPDAKVTVVTLPEYAPVLGEICDVHAGFLPEHAVGSRDACLFFEGVIEDNPEARDIPGWELFVHHAFEHRCFPGIPHVGIPRPTYGISAHEAEWSRNAFPRIGKPRVGIQPLASAVSRTYPPEFTVQVIRELVARDYEVFLFGKPGTIDSSELEGVVNLSEAGLTFRESVAVAVNCDCLIVPDSALLHAASVMSIPCISLWGAFRPNLRIPPGCKAYPIHKVASCSPCYHHESGSKKFPKGRPCELAGFCTVLAQIPPEEILEKVEGILAEKSQRERSRAC